MQPIVQGAGQFPGPTLAFLFAIVDPQTLACRSDSGAIVLMALGTQWVADAIAGASAGAVDLKGAMDNLGVHGVDRLAG